MRKQDTLAEQLLKDLEALTDRYGSFSLAKPEAQGKMRALVVEFFDKKQQTK
jgi:hypothetical protein